MIIHDTADPQVIIIEYELSGTVTTTGQVLRGADRNAPSDGPA